MSPLLLRKDRPWLLGGFVSGTIALGAALCDTSASRAFVFGADRLEALFHVSWLAGLLLGAVAACFDEVLGTREFLAQRPVPRAALVGARLCGAGGVLVLWLLAAPFGAWLVQWLQGEEVPLRLAALLPIWATMAVAVSACGIGLAAGSLPAPWWQRLLAAGAWFGIVFAVVHELTRGPDGHHAALLFLLLHLLAGAALFALAAAAGRHDADPDQPWPQRLRWVAAVPIVVAAAGMWAAACREGQETAIERLRRAWPQAERLGDRVVLSVPLGEWPDRRRAVVDRDHRPTGETFERPGGEHPVWEAGWLSFGRSYGFEEPRWFRHHDQVGALVLAHDGVAFVYGGSGRNRRLDRTGKGPQLTPFASGARLAWVGDAVLVHEPAAGLWRYDDALGHFVALEPPAGEVVQDLLELRIDDVADPDLKVWLADRHRTSFVRGERALYVYRAGALVAVPGLAAPPERRPAWWPAQLGDDEDALRRRLEVPAAGATPAFAHDLAPRTGWERLHAGTAMAWSLLRPPLLLALGHARAPSGRAAWLFDALTAGGRRTWLVSLGVGMTTVAAIWLGVWLRRRGAVAAVVRFWWGAALLFGPPAVIVALLLERPRRWARRHAAVPPPAPRIQTTHPVGVA